MLHRVLLLLAALFLARTTGLRVGNGSGGGGGSAASAVRQRNDEARDVVGGAQHDGKVA